MIKKILPILLLAIGFQSMNAQSNIVFRHLNTSHGLSYIVVNDMCSDRKGNLWLGTDNGLNMFNGKTVERYFATEYPQLINSRIIHVACDSSNRIWVLTENGYMTVIDEKRKFHRVILRDDKKKFIRSRWILETQQGNIVLHTAKGQYQLNPDVSVTGLDTLSSDQFTRIHIQGFDSLETVVYKQIFYYDNNRYLFVLEDVMYQVNYQTRILERKYDIPHSTALTKIDEGSLMVYDREGKEVKIIDLLTGETTFRFKDLRDQFGKPITGIFRYAEKIKDQQYVLTTQSSGIYIYNHLTQKIFHYTHHYADVHSISDNATTTLEVSPTGWVFITCAPIGVSYFNSHEIVGNQNVFIDEKGKGYNGLIAGITTRDNNTYYIGTVEGLVEWKRNTNTTHFLQYKDEKGGPLPKTPQEIISIVIDSLGQKWATTISQGIIVIDKNNKLLRHYTKTGKGKSAMKLERANRLLLGPDGYVWACGVNGLCRFNPATLEVDYLENSFLSAFDTLYCTHFIFTDKENLLISIAAAGARHCNLITHEIKEYTTKQGLSTNGVFDMGVDTNKNIYIGSRYGLNIIFPNGRVKQLTQKDGLLMNRAEGLLLDKHNRMWIGNDIGLACYTPEDSSLVTFDTRHGVSIYGYRVGSYFKMSNGEFVLGTPRGIQIFHPDSLFNKKIILNALIHKIETKNIATHISDNESFDLTSNDKQVTFHFSSVDFSPHVRTFYEYQLTGIDPGWVKIVDQNSVRYNNLPAGNYVFKVRISSDNKTWQNAENEVAISIASPFYLQWWFQLLSILSGIGAIILIIYSSRKKQKSQIEELETEVVINYFASQINRHKNVDEMLWDVAKNCISKLHLEECVIYLVDPEKDVLVQKAAYGPKNPKDYTILQPIHIPVGHGITGTVAKTKIAEIVNNTEKDPRYIVDDQQRLSEIAVPIIVDNQVIGIIDSEHPRKNFFTPKHMSLLTAIAVLSANQVQRIHAEEEKQKAQIEVLQNKQKATESRLQSLRLQMNPHFLFNALNSIQQMILANEEMVATRYLSRFSKLLRTILIHSDKETISLKEELDILKLYVELESVRFKEAFTYEIHCEDEIDADEVKIPTLLIQPFVENAIWHGLMHKEGIRHLKIAFTDKGDYVHCIIEDNGIGRQKAQELKITTGQDKKHTSKGIQVSMERLKALHKNGGAIGTMEIIDLMDEHGNAIGTRVEINLPIQN